MTTMTNDQLAEILESHAEGLERNPQWAALAAHQIRNLAVEVRRKGTR